MSQHLSSFHSPTPSYKENRDLFDTQLQLQQETKTKLYKGFWYQTKEHKYWIKRNIAVSIHKNIPFPCLSNCVNFAAESVTQLEAILTSDSEDQEPIEGATSWVAGYTLVLKNQKQYWRPFGSWQLIPTIKTDEVTCLGHRPNPNFLPYSNWFHSALSSLSRKTDLETSKHILSFLQWRHLSISEASSTSPEPPEPEVPNYLPLLDRETSPGIVEITKQHHQQIAQRKQQKRKFAVKPKERIRKPRYPPEEIFEEDDFPAGCVLWRLNLLRNLGKKHTTITQKLSNIKTFKSN